VTGLVADCYGKMPGHIRAPNPRALVAGRRTGCAPDHGDGRAMGAAMDLIGGTSNLLRRVAGEAALPPRPTGTLPPSPGRPRRRPERINAREVRRSWRLPGLRETADAAAAINVLVEAPLVGTAPGCP
jgi:hypothetical protein